MTLRRITALIALLCIAHPCRAADEETLPPLQEGQALKSIDDIWAGFDPRKEPLEIEVLKEWEDDSMVCRSVRYRIGVFKGTKSMMAGIFAFPKGGKNLPGLVQVHGGGQSANLAAAMTNARRGYACISLNARNHPNLTLDHLRRFQGVGRGWQREQFEQTSIAFHSSIPRCRMRRGK